MKKCVIGCLTAATLLVPATASAHDAGSAEHRNKYLRAKLIDVADSQRAPGRDIVRDGVLKKNGDARKATKAEVGDYLDTMRRMVAPPPAPRRVAAASTSSVSTSTASSSGASSGYALPTAIVMCESGGNYRAVNPNNSNRPAGAYQMITSTWLAWGGGKYAPTADQATPAQQDEIAAVGWANGAGAGNWECKG